MLAAGLRVGDVAVRLCSAARQLDCTSPISDLVRYYELSCAKGRDCSELFLYTFFMWVRISA